MTEVSFTKLAQSLPSAVPFVGPEQQEREAERSFALRIGANESLYGPSPAVVVAMSAAAADAWMYGDPQVHDLRHAIAAHHGVAAENVVVGEGIDGLQGYLVRLFAGAGDAVVTSDGAYPTFNYHAVGFGATIHKVPYAGDCEDPDALVAKVAEVSAKLVYFANPDNPMGTWHTADVVQSMIDRLPLGCTMVLDEAYLETAPEGTAPTIDVSNPSVLRMRTFSKAYGLAGLRVGYAIGHADVIQGFEKVRNHFGMGRVQQAGALAALGDQAYLTQIIAQIAKDRDALCAMVREFGLTPIPSATNFVAVDCKHDGAFAKRVVQALAAEGIFVRMPAIAPLNRCVRIGVPDAAGLELLRVALPKALKAAHKQ